MKKILLMVLAVLFIYQPVVSFGQEIEIKGISLGMSKDKFDNTIDRSGVEDFTIGGVKSKYPNPLSDANFTLFYDNKLDQFVFLFDSSKFEDVLSAVKTKYPEIKCVDSEISNAMGAKFNQVTCILKGDNGDLGVNKFSNDIKTSGLILHSNRLLKKALAKDKEQQKDI